MIPKNLGLAPGEFLDVVATPPANGREGAHLGRRGRRVRLGGVLDDVEQALDIAGLIEASHVAPVEHLGLIAADHDHDLGGGAARSVLGRRRDAARVGQVVVHRDDVRLMPEGLLQGLGRIRRDRDDLDVVRRREYPLELLGDDRSVADEMRPAVRRALVRPGSTIPVAVVPRTRRLRRPTLLDTGRSPARLTEVVTPDGCPSVDAHVGACPDADA